MNKNCAEKNCKKSLKKTECKNCDRSNNFKGTQKTLDTDEKGIFARKLEKVKPFGC